MLINPGDGRGEDLDPLMIDGATVRNGTSVGTSHLGPRLTNSGKAPRCQKSVITYSILMQAFVEKASVRQKNTQ